MYQSERGLHVVLEIVHEDTGLPVDLTSAEVLFRMAPRGHRTVLSKDCDVVGPGTVEVVFSGDDLDLPAGHYQREWRLVDGPTEQTVYVDEVSLRRSQFHDV